MPWFGGLQLDRLTAIQRYAIYFNFLFLLPVWDPAAVIVIMRTPEGGGGVLTQNPLPHPTSSTQVFHRPQHHPPTLHPPPSTLTPHPTPSSQPPSPSPWAASQTEQPCPCYPSSSRGTSRPPNSRTAVPAWGSFQGRRTRSVHQGGPL